MLEFEKYYAIKVRKYPKSADNMAESLKADVFLGLRGRLCSIDNAIAFRTVKEAQERIEKFTPKSKNKFNYKLSIEEFHSTIGSRGSVLTPKYFYISIKELPKERLIKQPNLKEPLLKGLLVLGGSNLPAKINKARWFETYDDAQSYINKLYEKSNYSDFKFEIMENIKQ